MFILFYSYRVQNIDFQGPLLLFFEFSFSFFFFWVRVRTHQEIYGPKFCFWGSNYSLTTIASHSAQQKKAGREKPAVGRNLPSQVKLSNEAGKPCNLYANNGDRVDRKSQKNPIYGGSMRIRETVFTTRHLIINSKKVGGLRTILPKKCLNELGQARIE